MREDNHKKRVSSNSLLQEKIKVMNVFNRLLTVPKNDEGITLYENGMGTSDSEDTFVLPEDEADRLWGTFQVINDKCGLLIDDYEEEIITYDNLRKAKEIVLALDVNAPVFLMALNLAIERKTIVGMDF